MTRRSFALDIADVAFTTGLTLLAGPNGSGKTTLFRAILDPRGRGASSITLDGERLAPEEIGYLPQRPSLPRDLSVAETLAYAIGLHRHGRAARAARLEELLAEFELGEYRDHPCRHLSGGTARRTAIACAIAHDPRVILLDEPTNDLDPLQRLSVRDLIRDLARTHICVVSSHALNDLLPSCDTLLLLDEGRVLFSGTRAEWSAEAAVLPGAPAADADEQFIGYLNEHRRQRSGARRA